MYRVDLAQLAPAVHKYVIYAKGTSAAATPAFILFVQYYWC